MDESLKRDNEQDAAMAASEGKLPPNTRQSEGVGTPESGTDTDATQAGVNPGGLTGGYGTGGVTPEEQANEGNA